MAAALQLTFPLIVTPYGIAALIAVFAAGREATPTQIYVLLGVVMLLNLLTMLFVRQIMRPPVLLVLQLVGAVLGILQVALAVQIVIRGLRELGVLALP
jgi:multiple antibiotic resistance protein